MPMFSNRQRLISCILSAFLFAAAVIPQNTVQAAQPITVTVDGQAVSFDKQPEIVNDRIVVQIRAIAEKLGCSVVWDDAAQTSYINQPGVPLQQTAVKGKDIQVYVNNQPVDFPDQKPLMMDDYVMILSRPVVEKLGCTIDWNDQTQTQSISSGGGNQPIPASGANPSTPVKPPVTPNVTAAPTPAVTAVPAPSGELTLLSITSPLNRSNIATLKGKVNLTRPIQLRFTIHPAYRPPMGYQDLTRLKHPIPTAWSLGHGKLALKHPSKRII